MSIIRFNERMYVLEQILIIFSITGSKRLIEHLYACKVPIALATSSGKESVEAKTLNYLKLFDSFHHKVMGSSDSEVKYGKPHPDIFLICASRFPENPNPENVGFCSILLTLCYI